MNFQEFRITCEACPLQIEGKVEGKSFYFRARHERWRIESPNPYEGIDDWNQVTPEQAKVIIDREKENTISSGYGDDFTYGEAIDLIYREMTKETK